MDRYLNKPVMYYDTLGFMCYGKIVAIEPYPQDRNLAWIYIEDEDDDVNTMQDMVNGALIKYAALRISTDVILDNNKGGVFK